MNRSSIFIPMFIVSLAIPVFFFIGPLRLSSYRIFLLVGIFPALYFWATNAKIPKILPDFLVLFFPVWATLALASHYGISFAIEAGGMLFIETAGAYFIARVLIQNADRFEQLIKWLIWTVLCLLPFALIEAVTGQEILIEFFRVFGKTHGIIHADPRWGFDRVQGPFEHPIHYGVFCGTALSFAFYYKAEIQSFLYRALRASIILFTAIWSLSSGPLTGLVAQLLLIAYDLVTRSIAKRWKILIGGVVAAWIAVDLFSNRTPPEVFITYFAFSAHTAYNRINIWVYGTQSIAKHPLLGIGYEEYERPWHVYSSSIDMFWILPSMQFGIPAGFALLGAFIYITLRVARAKISNPREIILRRATMICFVGLILSGWTVHYWAAMYSLVIFLFASGIWFFTRPFNADNEECLGTSQAEVNKTRPTRQSKRMGYTRTKGSGGTSTVREHSKSRDQT
jgi:hypothetical protein